VLHSGGGRYVSRVAAQHAHILNLYAQHITRIEATHHATTAAIVNISIGSPTLALQLLLLLVLMLLPLMVMLSLRASC
jgi:hypothetical protein